METISGHCPVCRSKILEGATSCPSCETPHHKECWDYNGKCAIFACRGKPLLVKEPVQIYLGYGNKLLDTVFALLLAVPLFLLVMTIISADKMTVHNDEVVVKSYPSITRSCWVFDEGQTYYPLFSTITSYKKKASFYFSENVLFVDGVVANISGAVEYKLPDSFVDIEFLHQKYSSQKEIEKQLIKEEVFRTLTKTSRMMTSVESYNDRGVKFNKLFADQLQGGDYVVMLRDDKVTHPVTKKEMNICGYIPVTRPYGDIIRDPKSSKAFGIEVNNSSADILYQRDFLDVMYQSERVEIEKKREAREVKMKRRAHEKDIRDIFKFLQFPF